MMQLFHTTRIKRDFSGLATAQMRSPRLKTYLNTLYKPRTLIWSYLPDMKLNIGYHLRNFQNVKYALCDMGIWKKWYPVFPNRTYRCVRNCRYTAVFDDGFAVGDSFYTSKWDVGQLALLDLRANRKSTVCTCMRVVFVTLLRAAINQTSLWKRVDYPTRFDVGTYF